MQSRKTGERPVADIEEGYISTACCILANLSMELGRSLKLGREGRKGCRRRRSQSPARPPLSRTLETSDSGKCVAGWASIRPGQDRQVNEFAGHDFDFAGNADADGEAEFHVGEFDGS